MNFASKIKADTEYENSRAANVDRTNHSQKRIFPVLIHLSYIKEPLDFSSER